ncbi:hypothetical protein BDW62DRAFT_188967 [Aspergillus aurantiobrunneus]
MIWRLRTQTVDCRLWTVCPTIRNLQRFSRLSRFYESDRSQTPSNRDSDASSRAEVLSHHPQKAKTHGNSPNFPSPMHMVRGSRVESEILFLYESIHTLHETIRTFSLSSPTLQPLVRHTNAGQPFPRSPIPCRGPSSRRHPLAPRVRNFRSDAPAIIAAPKSPKIVSPLYQKGTPGR